MGKNFHGILMWLGQPVLKCVCNMQGWNKYIFEEVREGVIIPLPSFYEMRQWCLNKRTEKCIYVVCERKQNESSLTTSASKSLRGLVPLSEIPLLTEARLNLKLSHVAIWWVFLYICQKGGASSGKISIGGTPTTGPAWIMIPVLRIGVGISICLQLLIVKVTLVDECVMQVKLKLLELDQCPSHDTLIVLVHFIVTSGTCSTGY